MEILGEIVFAVVQLLGELLLQLLAEALAEFGLEAIREAIRPSEPGRPLVAAIGHGRSISHGAQISLKPPVAACLP